MQYAIYASDGIEEYRIGVGRYWFTAKRQFERLDKTHLRSAKLIMITEQGRKLDTIMRWPTQTQRRVA